MATHVAQAEPIVFVVAAGLSHMENGHQTRKDNYFINLGKDASALASNLHVQACTPSDHVCSAFVLPEPPQLLNQEPPGAQQLTLPDFLKVPHFEHAIIVPIDEVMTGVLADVAVGVLTMSSRSGIGRRDTCCRGACLVTAVTVDLHVADIDPEDPSNMSFLLAADRDQSGPQSLWSNDTAFKNISFILVTLDTSH